MISKSKLRQLERNTSDTILFHPIFCNFHYSKFRNSFVVFQFWLQLIPSSFFNTYKVCSLSVSRLQYNICQQSPFHNHPLVHCSMPLMCCWCSTVTFGHLPELKCDKQYKAGQSLPSSPLCLAYIHATGLWPIRGGRGSPCLSLAINNVSYIIFHHQKRLDHKLFEIISALYQIYH